jgi:hypothetical protein
VITNGRDLDATAHTERLRPGELVPELLQAAAARADGPLAPVVLTTRPATRRAHPRRGHRHQAGLSGS